MKIKKKFIYDGIELTIVEREEPYMNSTEPVLMTRVLSINGGLIPVSIKHKQTLKSIMNDTIQFLDGLKLVGCDVKHELTKEI